MFGSPIIRLAIGVPIAAIVTFLLFTLMENLIRVDKVCPPGQVENERGECVKQDSRNLRNIFAEKAEVQTVRTNRKEVKKMNKAKKPPPPPKMTATKSNVDLPTPKIEGAAPTEIKFDRVSNINLGAVMVNDRDAQPVKPPNSTILARAIEKYGKTGTCEVRLDVDVEGKPFNVQASCDPSIYNSAAKRAVSQAEFAPKIVKGKPVGRTGVVYPFELRMPE